MNKHLLIISLAAAIPAAALAQEGRGFVEKALMQDMRGTQAPEGPARAAAIARLAAWARAHHLEASVDGKKSLEQSRQEALAALAIRQAVLSREIPESDLKLAYEKIKEGYKGKQEYKVRHFIMASQADAENILKQLRTGADFAKLAKEKSVDGASAAVGGEAGWLTDCMLGCNYTEGLKAQIKEVGLKKLPKTVLSSPMGWFVSIVDDVRPMKMPTYAEARPGLLLQARMARSQQALDSFFKEVKVERLALMR